MSGQSSGAFKMPQGASSNLSPNWHVRAVSVPGPDTDLTLHVAFDNARFMFGCGEGTQRAYVQKKVSMRGLQAIFLPNTSSRTRAGLPGVIMTSADASVSKLDVIGPPDTAHYISTFRSSVQREGFVVDAHSHPRDLGSDEMTTVYTSPHMTVRGLSLRPEDCEPGPSRRTSTEVHPTASDAPDWEPFTNTLRPTQLSQDKIDRWQSMIVSDMFGRQVRPPLPAVDRETNGTPFVVARRFSPAKADIRYPLPLPPIEDRHVDMAYVCHTPDVRGKFDAVRAAQLKVPNGPIRGRLTKGETIEVDDESAPGGKRIVRPEDCMSGGRPGSILVVVTCDEKTLPSLLRSKAFAQYHIGEGQATPEHVVTAVVHRIPRPVRSKEAYKEWMARFGPSTQHLIAQTDAYSQDVFFTSSAWNTVNLNHLDSDFVVRPHVGAGEVASAAFASNFTTLTPDLAMKMFPVGTVQPIPRHSRDLEYPRTPDDLAKATEQVIGNLPEYSEACDKAREAVQQIQESIASNEIAQPAHHDVVVQTMGTGSAIPSKHRNVSCTIVRAPGSGSILLDCGEGSLGQLRRTYSLEGMRDFYASLKLIFISHMHADHHLGLQGILEDRLRLGIEQPLYVVAPAWIALQMQETWAWQSKASDEALYNIKFLPSQRFLKSLAADAIESSGSPGRAASPDHAGQQAMFDGKRRWPMEDRLGWSAEANSAFWRDWREMASALQLQSLHAPYVQHRGHNCHGLVLEQQSGFKLVYSGDTMPCDSLIEAGRNATLLIHEATLEDDKPEMALAKGHSTFSQAIDAGRKMKARHVLLTHFSQRYPKIPKLPTVAPGDATSPSSSADEPIVALAFDFMQIRVADMWKMAHYTEALNTLYATDEDADAEADGDGDGEAVLQAVAKDVNASVAPPTPIGPAGQGKSKKQNKKQKQKNNEQQQQQKQRGKNTVLITDSAQDKGSERTPVATEDAALSSDGSSKRMRGETPASDGETGVKRTKSG